MALTKYKLGEFLELRGVINKDLTFGIDDVRGINNNKSLMSTKADLNGRDLSKFQIVYPNEFVFNHRTSRNGSKFSIALNDNNTPIICTEDYVTFRIREDKNNILNSRWLYMFFCRSEFDRYVITNSWGSSTEFYNWEDLCNIEISIPSIDIQKKYVAIYNSLLANQKSYERGLDDLKLVCDAYIEDLRRKYPCKAIGEYIEEVDERNTDLKHQVDNVMGISTGKEFIETKANMDGVSVSSYKVVNPDEFVYVPDTSRRGEKMAMAYNQMGKSVLVSSIYTVFRVSAPERLNSKYLFLFFSRSEFDRYSRFHSWGSARETFDWQDMQEVCIPIPDIKLQNSIADIFEVYSHRISVNERLKQQIKDICPILIKGSIEEAQKKN